MIRISESPTAAITATQKVASLGADVVWYDELISQYNMTQAQMQAMINSGLSVNPRLQFVFTEYLKANVINAYMWSANYSQVRISTDNYDDKSIMDLGISLAAYYGKRPMAWLIFVPGSQSFDCYNNLPVWINATEERNLDAFFWYADSNGSWQTNWPLVMNYNQNLSFSKNFAVPSNLISNPSFEGYTYQLDANNTNFQDWEIHRTPDNGAINTWVDTNTHSGNKAFHWKTVAPNATNISLNYFSNTSKKFLINESGYIEAGASGNVLSYKQYYGISSDISIYFYSSTGTFLGRFWGQDAYGSWTPGFWGASSHLWYPSSMGTGDGYIPKGAKYGFVNIFQNWHNGGTVERIEDNVYVRQWNSYPDYLARNASANSP